MYFQIQSMMIHRETRMSIETTNEHNKEMYDEEKSFGRNPCSGIRSDDVRLRRKRRTCTERN